MNRPLSREDFTLAAELGFNFVRIPIDYRIYSGSAGQSPFDEAFFKNLDDAIGWANELGLHVCLNLHRIPGYTIAQPREKRSIWNESAMLDLAAEHWGYFAKRYAGIPSDRLSFNLINEPQGGKTEDYIRVVRRLCEVIREHSPDRLIIADGFPHARRPVPDLIPLRVAQACRGYFPGDISHYMATWMGRLHYTAPCWPPNGIPHVLYGPDSKVASQPLVIRGNFENTFQVEIDIIGVTGDCSLQVTADGKTLADQPLPAGFGNDSDHTARMSSPVDVQTVRVLLPTGVESLSIACSAGEFIRFRAVRLMRQHEGQVTQHSVLPGDARWMAGPAGEVLYQPTQSAAITYPVMDGPRYLLENYYQPWIDLKKQGVGVIVGEWGAWSSTPHPVTLAWMKDMLALMEENQLPWALWELQGHFGLFESNRQDVDYGELHGLKVDQAMYDLIKPTLPAGSR
jgi:hypothetical protein